MVDCSWEGSLGMVALGWVGEMELLVENWGVVGGLGLVVESRLVAVYCYDSV